MLSACRVVDLTDERAQLAGSILAALGADVVLVEPPGGSGGRHVGPFAGPQPDAEASLTFWAYNRGKRSVVADLATEAGRAALAELVARADVLIENHPVGELAALGLGPDVLAAANPALVHVSVSPFGQTGPKARWASCDLTLQAAAGALVLTGDRDRAPLQLAPAPQAWLHGAAEAAQAALIALYERDHHSGLGQHADVSVQQAANQIAASQMLTAPLRATTTQRSAGGVVYGGIDVKLMWPCADGHVSVTFLFGAAIGPFTRRLMEWVHEEGGCDDATRDKDWINYSAMLLDGREPVSEYERIRDRVLGEFFAARTKADLLEAAVHRRLLIAPVATAADVLASPQLAARDYWQKVDQGSHGMVTFPGAIAKLSRTPLQPLPAAPQLGEHTATAPAAWPRRAPVHAAGPRRAPTANAGALAGLRVLDLMWVMAGPAASRVLADHGADVIRVESARRIDTARTLAPFVDNEGHPERSGLFNNLNANKRGLALDLSNPASHEIIMDLVGWADVVLDAFSPRGMSALGLHHDELLARKPDLIVASTCLNGQTGPLSSLAGFGTMAAAMSGFFHLCGWPDRAPSGPFGAYTDYVSPRYFLCTILAALEHRRRTGEGQYIDCSQSEASIHNLTPVLLDAAINGHVAQRNGNAHHRHAPHGVYPTSGHDRWIALACGTDEQWQRLCRLIGPAAQPFALLRGAERHAQRAALDTVISEWTAPQSGAELEAALQAHDIAAHVVANSAEACSDPQLQHRGHFACVPHAVLGTTWIETSRFTLSRTPAVMRHAGPALGEHTYDVLTEVLGYDADRVADLAAATLLE